MLLDPRLECFELLQLLFCSEALGSFRLQDRRKDCFVGNWVKRILGRGCADFCGLFLKQIFLNQREDVLLAR